MAEEHLKSEVVQETKLSKYMIEKLSKKYSLGVIRGRCKYYTEEELEFIKLAAHYRRFGRLIYKLYTYIKNHQGSVDTEVRKALHMSIYKFNICLYELTHMCYLWEDEVIVNSGGSPKTVLYIEGEFFSTYMNLFEQWRKDEEFRVYGRTIKD